VTFQQPECENSVLECPGSSKSVLALHPFVIPVYPFLNIAFNKRKV